MAYRIDESDQILRAAGLQESHSATYSTQWPQTLRGVDKIILHGQTQKDCQDTHRETFSKDQLSVLSPCLLFCSLCSCLNKSQCCAHTKASVSFSTGRAGLSQGCTALAYLNVTQGAPQDTEVGCLFFVHVWNVPFQGLKALFEMCSSSAKTVWQTRMSNWTPPNSRNYLVYLI